MGLVHQRDIKKRIWCPARWYAQPQGQGISVETLIIVYLLFADDLVLFSDSEEFKKNN